MTVRFSKDLRVDADVELDQLKANLERGVTTIQKMWLAAWLGNEPAQKLLESGPVHRALANLGNGPIGPVLQSFDNDNSFTRRVLLVVAKKLLPAWQVLFPDDPLGQHVVDSIEHAISHGPNPDIKQHLGDKIGCGRYGMVSESSWLAALLRKAHEPKPSLNFKDEVVVPLIGTDQNIQDNALALDILNQELSMWLLTGREISISQR